MKKSYTERKTNDVAKGELVELSPKRLNTWQKQNRMQKQQSNVKKKKKIITEKPHEIEHIKLLMKI